MTVRYCLRAPRSARAPPSIEHSSLSWRTARDVGFYHGGDALYVLDQSRGTGHSAHPTLEIWLAGAAADGSPISGQSTFKYDGKDYSFTGSPNYDTLSLKRVNGSTVKSTQKKAAKVVGTTTRTISAHGKVLTLSSKGIDAKGIPYDDVAVYDKQ